MENAVKADSKSSFTKEEVMALKGKVLKFKGEKSFCSLRKGALGLVVSYMLINDEHVLRVEMSDVVTNNTLNCGVLVKKVIHLTKKESVFFVSYDIKEIDFFLPEDAIALLGKVVVSMFDMKILSGGRVGIRTEEKGKIVGVAFSSVFASEKNDLMRDDKENHMCILVRFKTHSLNFNFKGYKSKLKLV